MVFYLVVCFLVKVVVFIARPHTI